MASLADQINNGPMLFAPLEMIQSQRHGFMPPQAAREQQCEAMRGRVFLSIADGQVLAKVLGPAPQSAIFVYLSLLAPSIANQLYFGRITSNSERTAATSPDH